jgi:hypothetical protein
MDQPRPLPPPSLNPSSSMGSPDYLLTLERRIMQLEAEIQRLHMQQQQADSSLSSVYRRLPDIGILSPNFLRRAFTAYGYTLVAGLIVAIPIYCIIFLISLSNF